MSRYQDTVTYFSSSGGHSGGCRGPAGWLIAWYAGGARREARPVIARPSRAHFQLFRPRVYYSEEIGRASQTSVVLGIFIGIGSGDHHNGSVCTRDSEIR